ncbi:hypothetical protein ABIC63_001702 [Pseudacidovorax sp. 1753]
MKVELCLNYLLANTRGTRVKLLVHDGFGV